VALRPQPNIMNICLRLWSAAADLPLSAGQLAGCRTPVHRLPASPRKRSRPGVREKGLVAGFAASMLAQIQSGSSAAALKMPGKEKCRNSCPRACSRLRPASWPWRKGQRSAGWRQNAVLWLHCVRSRTVLSRNRTLILQVSSATEVVKAFVLRGSLKVSERHKGCAYQARLRAFDRR
jgi:hypothetical protein